MSQASPGPSEPIGLGPQLRNSMKGSGWTVQEREEGDVTGAKFSEGMRFGGRISQSIILSVKS